jgi:hypothetical protein
MCGGIRTEGRFKVIRVFMLLAVVAALASAGSASATPLDFTFDSNNQSWLQNQDQASTNFVAAGFQSTGGNPDGHLTAKDSGAEGGCPDAAPCQLLTFYSPVVPSLGANYGGTASFDLRSSVLPAHAAELLLLSSPPNYLDGFIPETVATTYEHLSIPLSETATISGNPAWEVCPYAGGACTPASHGDFMSLIARTDGIAVMVDVSANGTGETYDLDNVALTDGPPQAPPPPPQKHKRCKKKRHSHKGHRASAAKKCKKKRRAATSFVRG